MRNSRAVLAEALKLPTSERADVASELLASLEPSADTSLKEVERAWGAEIERRARRVLAGESRGRPWSELRSALEDSLTRQ